jgi:hypothetical protein
VRLLVSLVFDLADREPPPVFYFDQSPPDSCED